MKKTSIHPYENGLFVDFHKTVTWFKQSRMRLPLVWSGMILCCSISSIQACGIKWILPQSHFDGVNEQGTVLYCDKIGEIQLGNGLTLPLNIEFKSEWENDSPTLGYGWMLPLLEARVEPTDRNLCKMRMPGGWYKIFWRGFGEENKNLWEGSDRWRAQEDGDLFTAWASCGEKQVYQKGKLISMTLLEKDKIQEKPGEPPVSPGRTLSLIYDKGRVVEIRDGEKPVLKVVTNPQGEICGLDVDGKTISFEYTQRPQIEWKDGKNTVVAQRRCVSKITTAEGVVKTYDYQTDASLNPSIKIDQTRSLVWDAKTKQIRTDGEWTYDIKYDGKQNHYAAIGRTNGKKQMEFWFDEKEKGVETEIDLDGKKTTTCRFISGRLRGKNRSLMTEQNGKILHSEKTIYDENGHIVRTIIDGETKTYGKDGAILRIEREGKVTFAQVTNDQEIGKAEYSQKTIVLPDGKSEIQFYKGKELNHTFVLDKDGKVIFIK